MFWRTKPNWAFVLSHEMTHSIEKHVWREHEYHKKALMALKIGGAIGAAYGGRGVADLANMVEAGIRTATLGLWKIKQIAREWNGCSRPATILERRPAHGKLSPRRTVTTGQTCFWDNHDNNATRRSYLMAELKNNYSETDFSSLEER